VRRVLMVTPHFPPDSSAAAHRVRLLAPHLPAAGWMPTILTLEPSAYEGRLDPALAALVPTTLDVVRASAWPARWTRYAGFGDLGLRALTGLRRACRSLLATRQFDALFITVYPVYPALLGHSLKTTFGVRFVLDYQDPWVGEWGRSVGGGRDGEPDWKSRASRALGEWLEPHAVAAADALTAVSQGTLDGIARRIPRARGAVQDVIPLGYEPADFEAVRRERRRHPRFDQTDGNVHLCYVGTLLPTGVDTVRVLLTAVARARQTEPAASKLRLHFYGTSNQSVGDRCRVLSIAQSCGLADVVTETPGRLDYLDALAALGDASAILLLGSSEPHYTASKLYPALMARRPLVALFHQASSVVSTLRDVTREPTVRLIAYERPEGDALIDHVARHLIALAHDCRYRPADVDFARAAQLSAPELARRLASVLDRVAA